MNTYDIIIIGGGQSALACAYFLQRSGLKSLNIVDENGKVETTETKSTTTPGLYLVGYGNWTGFASATLIGVGRSARNTINQITEDLKQTI